MKTLLPLILIFALAVACTGIPNEEVRSAEQIPTATMTTIVSIGHSVTSTRIPSQTSTPAISVTATPLRTAYPSATLPPSCGTVQLGKPGTQTKESNHPVLIEGTAIFCNHSSLFDEEDMTKVIPKQEAMLDLDSGSATIETTADIGFGVFGRMRFYAVVDINNARATFWSLSGLTGELPPQPTFDQCKEQVKLFSNDNEPLFVCVITNQGHVARVKVEKFNPLEQISSVEISFITWDEKVENP
jgi:hypothetical protein